MPVAAKKTDRYGMPCARSRLHLADGAEWQILAVRAEILACRQLYNTTPADGQMFPELALGAGSRIARRC